MNIQIKYFANLAEALGCTEETVSLPNGVNTVRQLKALLSARGDSWTTKLNDQSTRTAVNQTLAQDDTQLSEGAEVAFFPPVTGG